MTPATVPLDLRGTVAVVVGGSRGIGAATVRLLARRGSRVAVAARDMAAVTDLVTEVRAGGGEASGFQVDATDRSSLERLGADVHDELGPTDIFMPFSGGPGPVAGYAGLGPDDWSGVIAANLTSTVLGLSTFVPSMQERGCGSVVTMGSTAGRVADSGMSAAYATAKAAVHHLTRAVAHEVAPSGVRVNCVVPGTTLSERVSRRMGEHPELSEKLLRPVPMGRFGTPEEVAAAAVFLASPAASAMTGVTLDVSLGRVTG